MNLIPVLPNPSKVIHPGKNPLTALIISLSCNKLYVQNLVLYEFWCISSMVSQKFPG